SYPWLDIPHIIRKGDREVTVEWNVRGKWHEVASTPGFLDITPISPDAVLVWQQGTWVQIDRDDPFRKIALPTASCGSPEVSPSREEVLCAACVAPGPGSPACERFEVETYDSVGNLESRVIHD